MSALTNLTIRVKLNLLVGIAVVATAAVAWVGRSSVDALATTSEHLVESGHRIALHMEADMMHDALRADVMSAILAGDDESKKLARADVAEHAKLFRDNLAENERSATDTGSSRAIASLGPTLDKYISEATRLVELGTTSPDAARAAMPGFLVVFGQLETGMAQVTDLLTSEAKIEQTGGLAEATRRLVVTSLIAGVLLIALGFLIGRSIVNRLGKAIEVLTAAAERDFSQRVVVTSTDEVGRMGETLNRALEAVDGAFVEVRRVAMTMAEAASSLAASSEEISSGAQEQAASLEETAASLEEITATVKQSAGNAQQASQLATGSRETAESGGHVVGEAVRAMNEISQSSRKIGDIITTIDEIALQTNLLALNAAVEAARAGEQGRGFAVVAAEVGNLAQRSAAAAKEVKTLIQDTLARVETGHGLVGQSGKALAEIITSVKKVTDIFGEIAAAAREQSAGVDQVNEAVAQMDRVTQSNSAQTSDLSRTADGLAGQASKLDALLSRFKLTGDRAAPPEESREERPQERAPRPVKRRAPVRRGTEDNGSDRDASAAPPRIGARNGVSRTTATDDHFEVV